MSKDHVILKITQLYFSSTQHEVNEASSERTRTVKMKGKREPVVGQTMEKVKEMSPQ